MGLSGRIVSRQTRLDGVGLRPKCCLEQAGLTLLSLSFSFLMAAHFEWGLCFRVPRPQILLAMVLDGPLSFYLDLLDRENPLGIQISSIQ